MDNDKADALFQAQIDFLNRQKKASPQAGKKRGRYQQGEHQHQAAFFARIRLHEDRHPELRLVCAVPNGAMLEKRQNPHTGEWYCPQGQKLKEAGLRPGIPDVLVLIPRPPHPFLAIEFKSADGRLSDDQKAIRDLILAQGAKYAVCRSAEEAWAVLTNYLNGR